LLAIAPVHAYQDTTQARQPHYFRVNYSFGGSNVGIIATGGFTYRINTLLLGVRTSYTESILAIRRPSWVLRDFSVLAGAAFKTKKGMVCIIVAPLY